MRSQRHAEQVRQTGQVAPGRGLERGGNGSGHATRSTRVRHGSRIEGVVNPKQLAEL